MSSESLILAIETATLGGSVALTRDREVLASLRGDDKISHSNTLLKDIKTILGNGGHPLNSVDVFAVATGPGSFTGLRIGIATVKGLAFTLQRPVVGIPTLEAIAHSAGICDRVVAVLPAGRGEVFVQMFSVSPDNIAPLDDATHISPARMFEKYSSWDSLCWCGEGARLHDDKIRQFAKQKGKTFGVERGGKSWTLLSDTPKLAENVAMLAARKIANRDLQSAQDVRAIYVRPSDAELKAQG